MIYTFWACDRDLFHASSSVISLHFGRPADSASLWRTAVGLRRPPDSSLSPGQPLSSMLVIRKIIKQTPYMHPVWCVLLFDSNEVRFTNNPPMFIYLFICNLKAFTWFCGVAPHWMAARKRSAAPALAPSSPSINSSSSSRRTSSSSSSRVRSSSSSSIIPRTGTAHCRSWLTLLLPFLQTYNKSRTSRKKSST